MQVRLTLLLPLLILTALVRAQTDHPPTCGQKELARQLYRLHPEFKKRHDAQEGLLSRQRRQGLMLPQSSLIQGGNPVVLPVVVHIIHNNREENISDAQVQQGIKYLNEAYAASGYYNANGSTNTHVQFCMAQRDPNGNATSGITRNVSPYTTMGGDTYYADDQHVKNLNRWNPYNYINIWVVKSIPGDVVGYSTLPEAHGSEYEGIVMEAGYFGSTEFNNVVLIHEIGHCLGMYHTFEGGCTNNNCQVDGDMVCDTPPDQSTAYIGCDASMNSCTTDVLSGFNTDQPDLTQDYMDYGNFNCMKVFTPGQSERMNWFVQNVLYSLLNCKSCMAPCLSPVNAAFTASASTVPANTTVNFTNHSVNASHFKWSVDGIGSSTSTDYSHAFPIQGRHVITIQASGDDVLCDSAVYTDTVIVTCPVKAGFTYPPGIIKAGETVTFTNTAAKATSYVWKVNTVEKGYSAGFSYTFQQPGIYTVTQLASGVCTDSMSVPVSIYDSAGNIPADICKPVTFQKLIVTNNQQVWGMNITRDSGYILCGNYGVPFVDAAGGAYAIKLNKGGGEEWARYLNPFSQEILNRIKENADGSFITCGWEYGFTTELHSKAVLMKLDAKGNVLWAKKVGRQNSIQDVALDITATNDGGYAFCGATHNDDFRSTDWLVSKTDANGNIIWTKTLDNGFYERAYSILSKGDTLIVAGIRTLTPGPRSEIVVTKMLAASGTIVQNEAYGVGNRSVENTCIFKINGGYLVGAESVADGFYYADMDQLAMQLDESLQPVRTVKVAIDIFGSPSTGIGPTPDGGFVTARISEGYYGPDYTDSSWMAMAKIGPDWGLEWIKQYPLAFADGHTVYTPKAAYATPDGGYVTSETTSRKGDYGEHVRIIKTNSQGNTPGCIVKNFGADIQIQPVNNQAFTWGTVQDITLDDPVNQNLDITENRNETIIPVQKCSTSDCDSIKLNGNNSVCSLADTVTYSAGRNAACVSSVLWQVDTTIAGIVGYSDTTIRLLFKKTGNVTLSSAIFTACKVLQDSVVIHINDSRTGLNLGPDIQLCSSSTVRLSAGKDFKTYSWNTGSVDSTLTAYLPGKYYVMVSDYCDNVFSDTVLISTAPAVKLNLAANAPRCDQDSITITATPGFKAYNWSPGYNSSSASTNSIKVWPAADTTYTVVATINDHCTVTDSTRVNVLKSATISIGNDTSFCLGDAITLYAPAGFNGYLWQDSSTGTSFTATQKGVYQLAALNANGCYSKASMQVAEVYSLPAVNLGRDGAMCLNNTVLHAGSGQKNYAWQDGSADSIFTVTANGTYWVTIIGEHGCGNTDTLHVTAMVAPPTGFLAPTVSLCENGSVQLSAINRWATYLWSTGVAEPSITTKQPGQYWLQVTDYNDCRGKDTVTVAVKADCPKVIYFPNAFTPNGDGHNDVFKPFAGAPLEKYSLQIYNRWGQKIFESNDASFGWDGKLKSVILNTGSYIYFCRYKFYNEAEGMVKGTMVVVR